MIVLPEPFNNTLMLGSTILLRWKFGHIPRLVSRNRQVDTIYRVGGDDIKLAIKVKVSDGDSPGLLAGCKFDALSERAIAFAEQDRNRIKVGEPL